MDTLAGPAPTGHPAPPGVPSDRQRPNRAGLYVFFALLFLSGFCLINEPDTFWYLRSGEEILRLHGLPAHDTFSYTSHQPWLNHEWLAEVLLALSYRAGRFVGLGLLQGLLLAGPLGALLLSRPTPGPGGSRVPGSLDGLAPLVYAAAAALLREGISPRAQLFSNFFFALTLALAARDAATPASSGKQGEGARPWQKDPLLLTVPIALLWTQIHGGNPNGVAVLGLLFLSGPSLRRAIYVGLAALLTCAGPYGAHVHEHFLNAHSTLPYIREWNPLSEALAHGSWSYRYFVVFDALGLVCLVLRRRRGENVRFLGLCFLIFTLVAVRYVRFVSEATLVAALIAAPVFAAVPLRRIGERLPLGLLAALVLLCGDWAGSSREVGFGLVPEKFPIEAVRYLREHHPRGPLFNSYNFGGYLLWAYPEEPVFIDGRAFTIYSEEQVRELWEIYQDPRRFADLEGRLGFRLAVLKREGRGDGLLAWLRKQPRWQVAHEDAVAVVLVKGASEP